MENPKIDYNGLHPDIFQNYGLFTEFIEHSLGNPNTIDVWKQRDPDTKITLNSLNFRSPEFGNVDLLVAGCSQTFGVGVDQQHIWPEVLAEMTQLTHANLAVPGNSVQQIVQSIYAYIRDYGKPNVGVLIVLPGLYRVPMPLRADSTVGKSIVAPDMEVYIQQINLAYAEEGARKTKVIPNYSKKPHNLYELLPYEVAFYHSMMALNSLIQYCKALNVELYISTWEPWTQELFNYIKLTSTTQRINLDLSSFFEFENLANFPATLRGVGCHQEEEYSYEGNNWELSRDGTGHMGVHQHLHFAESFLQELEKRQQNGTR